MSVLYMCIIGSHTTLSYDSIAACDLIRSHPSREGDDLGLNKDSPQAAPIWQWFGLAHGGSGSGFVVPDKSLFCSDLSKFCWLN